MSYAPRPGSVAYRTLAYLEQLPRGAEVMTCHIAEAIGCGPAQVAWSLSAAHAAGLVFARKRDAEHPTAPLWWSLVDHARPASSKRGNGASSAEDDVPVFLAPAARNGASWAPQASAGPQTSAGDRSPAVAPKTGLRVALWSDGWFQIWRDGVDAPLLMFTPDETRQLLAYLAGVRGGDRGQEG